MHSLVWRLLHLYSWQEMRHHAWRNGAAVVAVMLGVALALSVHLINASALDDFTQGMQSLQGSPDLELRAAGGAALDQRIFDRLTQDPDVSSASPVGEATTYARLTDAPERRVLLRLVGVDALQVAGSAPDLIPLASSVAPRLAMFSPDTVFLNPAAQALLNGTEVWVQLGMQWHAMQVAGSVRAAGPPLAVMDIAAWQELLGRQGQLTRIDLRLRAGVDHDRWVRDQLARPDWPHALQLARPGQAGERMQRLSRAYRVNLTVLALIALFTGSFLVYSVMAQSVARRSQQFALLAVLGLQTHECRALVLGEALVLGVLGSALGIALGTGLAALGLRMLGGDMGGGFFSGGTGELHWSAPAALAFAALGVAAAMAGAWWPARQAASLPPAQTLKGLGDAGSSTRPTAMGVALMVTGLLLALMPPVWDIPLAAYVSVALLLLGGIVALPWLVGWVLDRLAPWVQRDAMLLLPVERARRVRSSASVAVSGVVAALSLAVALTVMVTSFRTSVMQWLDGVLPADLYVRAAAQTSAGDAAYFDRRFVDATARLPGIQRVVQQRSMPIVLDPERPAVTLLSRAQLNTPELASGLSLLQGPVAPPPGHLAVYVSEAIVSLYGVALGREFTLLASMLPKNQATAAPRFHVAGIWRDYSRQFGTIVIDATDFARLASDTRANDIAFWLQPGTSTQVAQAAVQQLADQMASGQSVPLDFGSTEQIRATSLRIFDRSFAVTYWLQAVAIGIGLFGVAASFSAQVLARRKEFGLLVHLGLTRRQILGIVALEGAAWTALGALAGTLLGLAVGVVLVKVVNPQSFHWTMELNVPVLRLAALSFAVVVSGTLTAWMAGRAAASPQAVMAVKEDW